MTMLVSAVGVVGRMVGDLLTSALAWASSLLFGRVPRSHLIYLVMMMAASLLWIVAVVSLLMPGVASLLLATTPHPSVINRWLVAGLILAFLLLPLAIGLFGYLVPSEGDRPGGFAVVLELLRGYVLAPLIGGVLIFLAGVGLARKVRSFRHGWSDTHVPIVARPGAYEQLVDDLQHALESADFHLAARDAPWVLTLPARVLASVAGENVRRLRQDRLIELTGRDMRIDVYPSDIAISGKAADRTRARAAMVSKLATTSARLTMSAEAQWLEDQLAKLATSNGDGRRTRTRTRASLKKIDERLMELPVSTDEWDTLYRMRLQIELDALVHKERKATERHADGNS